MKAEHAQKFTKNISYMIHPFNSPATSLAMCRLYIAATNTSK